MGCFCYFGQHGKAAEVPNGNRKTISDSVTIKARIQKSIQVTSILPKSVELFPWHGHLGLHLIDELIPILQSRSKPGIHQYTRTSRALVFKSYLNESLSGPVKLPFIMVHWTEKFEIGWKKVFTKIG